MSRKFGIFLAIAWSICVVIAFIVYPRPDNLIVSYPVYLAFGVDGVEQLSGFTAFAIAAVQVLLAFCIGHFVGRRIERHRNDNDAG